MKLERHGRGHVGGRPKPRRGRWMVVGVGLAALLIGAAAGTWFWDGAGAAPEAAPKFNLFASTGRVIAIDEFLGKQDLVLIFYMGAG